MFEKPASIIRKLKQHGHDAYFVGGSVRDYIVGRAIGDIDIATSALPTEVMDIFEKHVPIGLQHGTILVIEEAESYEVTTFRVEEEYNDYRHPSHVAFVRTLTEDLKRRDFTMNAIAMTEEGEIIDPYNGQNDIHNKVIQTVGSAIERFHEDALRMMRALRFVSTLGFKLNEEVIHGIEQQKHLLSHIAKERLLTEMDKLFSGHNIKEAILLFTELKIYDCVPFIVNKPDVFTKVLEYEIQDLKHVPEYWALLLYLDGQQSATEVAGSWKMSNKHKNEISTILKGLKEVRENGWNEFLMYDLGLDASTSIQRIHLLLCQDLSENKVQKLVQAYIQLPIKERGDIVVTGNEFMRWCHDKPGPWIQEAFNGLERAILENDVQNEVESIRKWFLEWRNS